MATYYEIYREGETFGFETLEKAIAFAEASGDTLICEIGGSWTEYQKCWFCEEWVDATTTNSNSLCAKCEDYLKSRGEI